MFSCDVSEYKVFVMLVFSATEKNTAKENRECV